jgi:AcrR family transcriptional regulator
LSTTESIPERRAPLSRERVLQAALDLADEGGIEALSMRRLAAELGVEPMSLYYYVRNKDELLGAMLDAVFREMEPPASGPDWRSDMRLAAISARDTLMRHPWACGLIGVPTTPSLAQVGWMNALLGRLREAGFSAEMTHHAYHALDSHIVGFTLWLLPYLRIAKERPNFAEEFVAQVPLEDLPHLAEHIEQHQADRPGDVSEFEFGLDLILDGLERLRE